MKTLLISGFDGRMGRETARLAESYGFSPLPYEKGRPADAVIDFSHPDRLEELLPGSSPLVIGTTGFSLKQLGLVRQRASLRPIFLSPNFSAGIAAMRVLARQAKQMLPDWDISLIEQHHRTKADAPSGTAAEIASDLSLAVSDIVSVRAGTVRGTHSLAFYGPEEHLLLRHTAESRTAFAHGALKAADWLIGRAPGLYGVSDLMGFK